MTGPNPPILQIYSSHQSLLILYLSCQITTATTGSTVLPHYNMVWYGNKIKGQKPIKSSNGIDRYVCMLALILNVKTVKFCALPGYMRDEIIYKCSFIYI